MLNTVDSLSWCVIMKLIAVDFVNVILNTVVEVGGFRLSYPTKYSDGQPQLAMELSVGQPTHISGKFECSISKTTNNK